MDFSHYDMKIFLTVLKNKEKVETNWEKVVNCFHFIPSFIKRRNLILFFPHLFLLKKKIFPILTC